MGSDVVQKHWKLISFSSWEREDACPEDSALLGCALSQPRSPAQTRCHCFPLPRGKKEL